MPTTAATELTVTILGSGTSTGVPVVGCHCDVCRSSDPRNQRSRCSALLSYRGRNLLIDTSPDLRQQALREQIERIDAVFYTHSHADHLHGIDDLRVFSHRSAPLPLYGAQQTLNRIRTTFSYIFVPGEAVGYVPHLQLQPLSAAIQLFGLTIEPILLAHGGQPAYGYRCGPVAYLTDCNQIPDRSLAQLNNLELLVLDGLRFTPHRTHFNIPEAITMAQRIGARQTLLTHLSHEVDHPQHDPQLPPAINFAYDGWRGGFSLGDDAEKLTARE